MQHSINQLVSTKVTQLIKKNCNGHRIFYISIFPTFQSYLINLLKDYPMQALISIFQKAE